MQSLWKISLEDYIEIMEGAIALGKERGKKEGDNLEEEFFEIAKRKNKLSQHLGATELNKEELKKQYELKGLKILDLTKKNANKS